jgi:hypothetical protein
MDPYNLLYLTTPFFSFVFFSINANSLNEKKKTIILQLMTMTMKLSTYSLDIRRWGVGARHNEKCQPQSTMHANNNEESKKPLQATKGG